MPIRLATAIAFLMGIIVAVSAATTITVGQHGLVQRFLKTDHMRGIQFI